MRYSIGTHYGRARTAQRPKRPRGPQVWWDDIVYTVSGVRVTHKQGELITINDNTGMATVRFRNGRTQLVDMAILHEIKEEDHA